MAVQHSTISPPPVYDKISAEENKLGTSWFLWFNLLWEKVSKIRSYSSTLTPALVAANSTAEQTFTVNGLTTTDNVFVNKPTHQSGLGIINVRVSAADTLAITYINITGGGITPTAETYEITAIKRDLR